MFLTTLFPWFSPAHDAILKRQLADVPASVGYEAQVGMKTICLSLCSDQLDRCFILQCIHYVHHVQCSVGITCFIMNELTSCSPHPIYDVLQQLATAACEPVIQNTGIGFTHYTNFTPPAPGEGERVHQSHYERMEWAWHMSMHYHCNTHHHLLLQHPSLLIIATPITHTLLSSAMLQ